MTDPTITEDPSWDEPLTLSLTPAAILNTVFSSADNVHTAWQSCVEDHLIVAQTTAVAQMNANHCRLAEQEYADEEVPEETWHDWTVELQINDVYLMAHWRARVGVAQADWEWCTNEAEKAFTLGAALLGRRVRRGIMVEEAAEAPRMPRTRH